MLWSVTNRAVKGQTLQAWRGHSMVESIGPWLSKQHLMTLHCSIVGHVHLLHPVWAHCRLIFLDHDWRAYRICDDPWLYRWTVLFHTLLIVLTSKQSENVAVTLVSLSSCCWLLETMSSFYSHFKLPTDVRTLESSIIAMIQHIICDDIRTCCVYSMFLSQPFMI